MASLLPREVTPVSHSGASLATLFPANLRTFKHAHGLDWLTSVAIAPNDRTDRTPRLEKTDDLVASATGRDRCTTDRSNLYGLREISAPVARQMRVIVSATNTASVGE